jgi:hypothetical protein
LPLRALASDYSRFAAGTDELHNCGETRSELVRLAVAEVLRTTPALRRDLHRVGAFHTPDTCRSAPLDRTSWGTAARRASLSLATLAEAPARYGGPQGYQPHQCVRSVRRDDARIDRPGPVPSGQDELRRSRLGRSGSTARLPQIVRRGRDRRRSFRRHPHIGIARLAELVAAECGAPEPDFCKRYEEKPDPV